MLVHRKSTGVALLGQLDLHRPSVLKYAACSPMLKLFETRVIFNLPFGTLAVDYHVQDTENITRFCREMLPLGRSCLQMVGGQLS